MLLVFLAAATAHAQAQAPEIRPVIRQAQARVRIVSGTRIMQGEAPQEAQVRETRITAPDGSQTNARLIEFP